MFLKTFSRSNKQQDSPGAEVDATRSSGNVAEMVSASGKVSLSTLRKIAQAQDAEMFNAFIKVPVLAGSAIRAGRLSNRVSGDNQSTNSTRVLELPDSGTGESLVSESLQQAVYPLVRDRNKQGAENTFFIGRGNDNDIVVPDFAISKKHAAIDKQDNAYSLRDLYSTNGTMLNGTSLDQDGMELHDTDTIGLARYEFVFLWPESLYQMLRAE